MTEVSEVAPTDKQIAKTISEIAKAVNPKCEGCSAARFAPERLGAVVLAGKMTLETAQQWAADCTIGFEAGPPPVCHHGYEVE